MIRLVANSHPFPFAARFEQHQREIVLHANRAFELAVQDELERARLQQP